jgi:protein-S-isoprenylcysteine O-methyltransferase Ste14
MAVETMRVRLLVPVVFLALAALNAAGAARSIGAFIGQGGLQPALLALYAVLRTVVAIAFALFTVQRSEPHRRARGPVAFLACAVAMLAVVPVTGPSSDTSSALLLAGDAVAVVGSVWIFASVLALGRCFGVLPEARCLVMRGPYRLVRHPVYLGEIAVLVGLTIAAPAVSHLAMLAVFILAQSVRMRLEETALTEAFPEYAAYAAGTRRLLPIPRPALDAHRAVSHPLHPDLRPGRTGASSVVPAVGVGLALATPGRGRPANWKPATKGSQ